LAKVVFAAKVSPAIKTGMFQISLRLTLEVTSSQDRRGLLSFGSTEKCARSNLLLTQASRVQEFSGYFILTCEPQWNPIPFPSLNHNPSAEIDLTPRKSSFGFTLRLARSPSRHSIALYLYEFHSWCC
jgi:hypothetical protein